MIENLKIGYSVSKDQVMRILTEDIDTDNVLDAIDFDKWTIQYDQNGQAVREEFTDQEAMFNRYTELRAYAEFTIMGKMLRNIGGLSGYWQKRIKNV